MVLPATKAGRGSLVKLSTDIVLVASVACVNVTAEDGRVIEKVEVPSPVTVNEAAETVPAPALTPVAPPMNERAPAVEVTTVPPVASSAAKIAEVQVGGLRDRDRLDHSGAPRPPGSPSAAENCGTPFLARRITPGLTSDRPARSSASLLRPTLSSNVL